MDKQFLLHKDIPIGRYQLLLIGADNEEKLFTSDCSNFYGLMIEWIDKNRKLDDLNTISNEINSLITSGSLEASLRPINEINESEDIFTHIISGLGGNAFRNGILTFGDLFDHVNKKLRLSNQIDFNILPGHEELRTKLIGLNTDKIKEIDQTIAKKIEEFYELMDAVDISNFDKASQIIKNIKIYTNSELIALLEKDFGLQLRYNFKEITQWISENEHPLKNRLISQIFNSQSNDDVKQNFSNLRDIMEKKLSEMKKDDFLNFTQFIKLKDESSTFIFFKIICNYIKLFKTYKQNIKLNEDELNSFIMEFSVSLDESKNDSTNIQPKKNTYLNAGGI